MKLHSLLKTNARKAKRLGHGYGSGKGGHTSSRGQKGQLSRGSVRLSFTGSSWVWFKRLPFMRGKSRFNSFANETVILTLNDLNKLKTNTVVNPKNLNLPPATRLKVVATGKLTQPLIVEVRATKSAQQAIIQAKGEYRGTK
ncbi:MAG: LSU ribosomal protein L15p (L27Ae) [Microgenomates group bacterium GW2011_GWC2_45_8]|nr:MAG: LSU ribosomal protein L15p (L27Ae) [Microgenomates group bacterium GW2011_GWC2_45_8]KKU26339.1 MAG: LSU ribosomal protein L15p (L27Ae) [Microgenomates group bacterium GW2011_GWA2_46_16]